MSVSTARPAITAVALIAASLSFTSIASAAFWDKKPKASAKPEAESKASSQPGGSQDTSPEGRVAYTFKDDAQLEQFAKLWQQRQRSVLRMTVLQSYWNEEQQALEVLNEQFAKEYNLDLKKNYRFDPDRKVLVEVEPSDASAAATPTMQGRPAAPAAATQ
jgi:hypothetical protein